MYTYTHMYIHALITSHEFRSSGSNFPAGRLYVVGVRKGAFSKGGFSNNNDNMIITHE